MQSPLITFRPHTFSSFDTFRCPKQYRLATGPRPPKSAAELANPILQRGIDFERDVIDTLREACQTQKGIQLASEPPKLTANQASSIEPLPNKGLWAHLIKFVEDSSVEMLIIDQLELVPPKGLREEVLHVDPSLVALGSIMKPDIVILRKERPSSGSLQICLTIADIKSSSHPKRYHRMQIAFYDMTIEQAMKSEFSADILSKLVGSEVTLRHDVAGQIWLPLNSAKLGVVGPASSVGKLLDSQWGCINSVSFGMEAARGEVLAFFKMFIPIALRGRAVLDKSAGVITDIEDIPFELRPRCGICEHVATCQVGASMSAAMMLGMKRFGEEAGPSIQEPILELVPTTVPSQWTPLKKVQADLAASHDTNRMLVSLVTATSQAQQGKAIQPLPDNGLNCCSTVNGIDQKALNVIGNGDYAIVRFASIQVSGAPLEVVGQVHSPTYGGGTPKAFNGAAEMVQRLLEVEAASCLVVFTPADRLRLVTSLFAAATEFEPSDKQSRDGIGRLLKYADGLPARYTALSMPDATCNIGEPLRTGKVICVVETLTSYFALPIPRACLAGDIVKGQLLSFLEPSSPTSELLPSHVARLVSMITQAKIQVPTFASDPSFQQLVSSDGVADRLDASAATPQAALAIKKVLLVEQTAAMEQCALAQRTKVAEDGPLKNGPIAVDTVKVNIPNGNGALVAEAFILKEPLDGPAQWWRTCDPDGYYSEVRTLLEASANTSLDDFAKANIIGTSNAANNFAHLTHYTAMPFKVPGTCLDVAWATTDELVTHAPDAASRKHRLYPILLPAVKGISPPQSPVGVLTINGCPYSLLRGSGDRILVLQTAFSKNYVPNVKLLTPRVADYNTGSLLGGLRPHPMFLQYLLDGKSEANASCKEKFEAMRVPLETYDGTLSTDQRTFIEHIPIHKVTCLWGPPGTGKSFALSMMLLKYLLRGTKDDLRTPKPAAISPIKILVVAFTKSVVEDLKESLKRLAVGIAGEGGVSERSVSKKSSWPICLSAGQSTVTFSTVWQAIKKDNIPDGGYDLLVIDEASQLRACQALLASTCLGIANDDSVRIVLAGDMLQLSPIVPQAAASAAWAMQPDDQLLLLGSVLEASLFKTSPTGVDRPHLRAEELIVAGSAAAQQLLPANLVQLHVTWRGQGKKLIEFVGHIYPRYDPTKLVAGETQDRSRLFLRKIDLSLVAQGGEASALEDILRSLFTADSTKDPRTVGIVTPHRRQRIDARRVCEGFIQKSGARAEVNEGEKPKVHGQKPAKPTAANAAKQPIPNYATEAKKGPFDDDDDDENCFGGSTDGDEDEIIQLDEQGDPCRIAIDTVERMQGLEFDVVVILLANVTLSFVLNINRLNVAFSRARKDIYLVTSEAVLRPDPDAIDAICHKRGTMPLLPLVVDRQVRRKAEKNPSQAFQDDPPSGNLEPIAFPPEAFEEPPTHKGQFAAVAMAVNYLQRYEACAANF